MHGFAGFWSAEVERIGGFEARDEGALVAPGGEPAAAELGGEEAGVAFRPFAGFGEDFFGGFGRLGGFGCFGFGLGFWCHRGVGIWVVLDWKRNGRLGREVVEDEGWFRQG